jgi:hypothetical protein
MINPIRCQIVQHLIHPTNVSFRLQYVHGSDPLEILDKREMKTHCELFKLLILSVTLLKKLV